MYGQSEKLPFASDHPVLTYKITTLGLKNNLTIHSTHPLGHSIGIMEVTCAVMHCSTKRTQTTSTIEEKNFRYAIQFCGKKWDEEQLVKS